MESLGDSENSNESLKKDQTFKKPILIGKVGKLPRKTVLTKGPSALLENNTEIENIVKVKEVDESSNEVSDIEQIEQSISQEDTENVKDILIQTQKSPDTNLTLSYVEPTWSAIPVSEINYTFEVLKSGVIIDNINLMVKPYWVFGRLATCDIPMAHPTISRYHAVIQYKSDASENLPPGFYIYDLGSTHGTFLNKCRIKSKIYVRIQVGHMLKLGCSTRTFLLTGPNLDTEKESELTVTQLIKKRAEDLRLRQEKEQEEEDRLGKEKLKKEKMDREKGVSWGMAEDADEETDLAENPFAETNNEQLYLDDPKKALRGFMEREGVDLQYDVTERGMGQFLCTVSLPIDDAKGRPVVAEALIKGKKKEAVVQCALEACRILDRHGLLRQATHESKKRKAKNWEENDYYDSDEDTFLDRTGTIERKREKRMKAKQPQQPETYQSLVAKEDKLNEEIRSIENQLASVKSGSSKQSKDSDAVDPLDSYMLELNQSKPDKFTVGKLKIELTRLRKEQAEISKLVNLTRPANLPSLSGISNSQPSSSGSNIVKATQAKALPIFGKRLKVKVMLPSREVPTSTQQSEKKDSDNEMDGVEEVGSTTGSKSGSSQSSVVGCVGSTSGSSVGSVSQLESMIGIVSRSNQESVTGSVGSESVFSSVSESSLGSVTGSLLGSVTGSVGSTSGLLMESSQESKQGCVGSTSGSSVSGYSRSLTECVESTSGSTSGLLMDSVESSVGSVMESVESTSGSKSLVDSVGSTSEERSSVSKSGLIWSSSRLSAGSDDPMETMYDSSDDTQGMLQDFEKFKCDRKALESLEGKVNAKISKTVVKLGKIAEEEENIVVDEKRLAVQKRKIMGQLNKPSNEQDIDKQMKQLNRMTTEYYAIGDRKIKMVSKINKLAEDINKIAVQYRAASEIQHEQAINRMKGFVEKVHRQQVEIYNKLDKLENSSIDQKVIEKLRELHNWLSDQKDTMLDNLEKLKTTKVSENSKIFEEIIQFDEKSDCFIKTILEEIQKMQDNAQSIEVASGSKDVANDDEDCNEEKRKKKNMRRIMQRQGKAEVEKQKLYEEDALKEDYNMWVPPDDQTGDGRTNLNEKFGY